MRRSEKPVTAARGLEIAARARCIHPSAPHTPLPPLPLHPRRAAVCRGARDPNGAADGCDSPEAARRVAARRSVPRPADGTRRRSDGNHVSNSTLVSSLSWCVSLAAGSSDNHARCSCFLSLFLYLSLFLSLLPPPVPVVPAPPFTVTFFIFFSLLPCLSSSSHSGFCKTRRHTRGGGQPRSAREIRDRGGVLSRRAELCYRATTHPASRVRLEYGLPPVLRVAGERGPASHRYGDAGERKEGRAAMQRGAGTYVLAACCRRPGARGR